VYQRTFFPQKCIPSMNPNYTKQWKLFFMNKDKIGVQILIEDGCQWYEIYLLSIYQMCEHILPPLCTARAYVIFIYVTFKGRDLASIQQRNIYHTSSLCTFCLPTISRTHFVLKCVTCNMTWNRCNL